MKRRCREVQHYAEGDPFPEYEGEYRWIYGLRIDPAKTEGAHVFRPKKFKTAFIVSEEIKAALETGRESGSVVRARDGPQRRTGPVSVKGFVA